MATSSKFFLELFKCQHIHHPFRRKHLLLGILGLKRLQLLHVGYFDTALFRSPFLEYRIAETMFKTRLLFIVGLLVREQNKSKTPDSLGGASRFGFTSYVLSSSAKDKSALIASMQPWF